MKALIATRENIEVAYGIEGFDDGTCNNELQIRYNCLYGDLFEIYRSPFFIVIREDIKSALIRVNLEPFHFKSKFSIKTTK